MLPKRARLRLKYQIDGRNERYDITYPTSSLEPYCQCDVELSRASSRNENQTKLDGTKAVLLEHERNALKTDKDQIVTEYTLASVTRHVVIQEKLPEAREG